MNVYLPIIIYLNISSLRIAACNCEVSVDVLVSRRENILHRVHFFQARVLEQTQPGNAKVGVKDIDHITRSVGKATQLRILHTSALLSMTYALHIPGTAV
jgi:hypothetical protein